MLFFILVIVGLASLLMSWFNVSTENRKPYAELNSSDLLDDDQTKLALREDNVLRFQYEDLRSKLNSKDSGSIDYKIAETALKDFKEDNVNILEYLTGNLINEINAEKVILDKAVAHIDAKTTEDVTDKVLLAAISEVKVKAFLNANDFDAAEAELETFSEKAKPARILIIGGGFLDWFTAIPAGFLDAATIIVFLFVLGGFINVVLETRALEALIVWITGFLPKSKKPNINNANASAFEKRKTALFDGFRHTWIIIPLVLFFSFCGTTYGMAEESLAFYAILIPFAVAAGFDVFTGFLIVFLGAGVGVMFSTINPFSVISAIEAAEGSIEADHKIYVNKLDDSWLTAGAAWRWVGWVVGTIASTTAFMFYANRVRIDKSQAKLGDMFEVHQKTFAIIDSSSKTQEFTFRKKLTVTLFILTFVVMVLGMINWDTIFDSTFFQNLEEDVFGNNKFSTWFHNFYVTTGDRSIEAYWQVWYMMINCYQCLFLHCFVDYRIN